MTDRDRLVEARTLIKIQRYAEARTILKAMPNNETARKWLTKLDEVAPAKRRRHSTVVPLIALLLMIGGLTATAALIQRGRAVAPTSTPLLVVIAPTGTNAPVAPTVRPSDTAVPTATDTATPIPTDTLTLVPSATNTPLPPTVTDTPLPTETKTPVPTRTNTPRPPTATQAPLGTRSNPYPASQWVEIQGGSLQTGPLFFSDSAIERQNMFNPEPGPGEQWALALISFRCGVSSDDTCDLDALYYDLEMVGRLGHIYTVAFVSGDDRLGGEIFGGASVGDRWAGFLVDSDDSDFQLIVYQGGERKFFALHFMLNLMLPF